MQRVLWFLACLLVAAGPAQGTEGNPFPRPAELEHDVLFWVRVYTEVGTDGGFVHDAQNLGVVYETVHFPQGLGSRSRQRRVDQVKRRYRSALLKLASGRRQGLSDLEERVLALWGGPGTSNGTFRNAARQLRFQLGQADKFRAGLIRAGAWEPHIRNTFADLGLPIELAALPHVESSYTANAYSRVGAAGLWQFTRSTGRRYMRVDYVVDERLDPFRSTVAAARLLEQNRATTGSWPLAITAYNHGAAGVRRAVRRLGTRDIATIVRKYRSRTFGFASRNFYVEFLAATEVDFHADRYFGSLERNEPVDYDTVELPYFTHAGALGRALGVDLATLRESNPALRPAVWNGAKYVPRGFQLRVPRASLERPLAKAVEAVPREHRFAQQQRDTYHVVSRGETLSRIAARYGLRQSELVALNGLRSRHWIRAGQRLRLPQRASGRSATLASLPAEPPEDGVYTVRRGDTLSRIASHFGISERQLMSANGLGDRNRIFAGQRLRVADFDAVLVADARPSAPAAAKAELETAEAEVEAEETAVEAVAEAAHSPSGESGELELAATSPGIADESPADPAETAEEGASLAADPSDYSVADDRTIEVQAAETLGHYAEWLDIRASQLRRLNGMRYGEPLVIGQRLRLSFGEVTPEVFEGRRLAYHRALQGDFFDRFEIQGTRTHVLRRGDSLWSLAQHRYGIPVWLLRQYNPDLDFGALHAGTRVTIPLVRPHGDADAESGQPQGATSSEAHRVSGAGNAPS
jgi:membrane-bound lytic murein transglycosylase D